MIDLGPAFARIVRESKLQEITDIYLSSASSTEDKWNVFIDGNDSPTAEKPETNRIWRIISKDNLTKVQATTVKDRLTAQLIGLGFIEVTPAPPPVPPELLPIGQKVATFYMGGNYTGVIEGYADPANQTTEDPYYNIRFDGSDENFFPEPINLRRDEFELLAEEGDTNPPEEVNDGDEQGTAMVGSDSGDRPEVVGD